jgi:cobyrinic acid a,c-diamide synthase
LVAEAITAAGHRVLGSIPRENSLALPQRHLGLVQAREHPDLGGLIERLAERAEGCLDLDALTACATSMDTGSARVAPLPPPGQRIAIASDDAFTFMYPHLLRAWRKAGAEILLFSPLANEAPPLFCDVCWLPGGYPELHAGRIAGSERFLAGIRQFAEKNRVHGECGGYMVLGEAIIDASGESHAMAGLLGHVTSFAERKLCLGYRTATLLSDCAVGAAGLTVRGHEFHYATIAVPGAESPLVRLANGEGEPIGLAGGIRGRVSGTFFHALAASESGGASPRE